MMKERTFFADRGTALKAAAVAAGMVLVFFALARNVRETGRPADGSAPAARPAPLHFYEPPPLTSYDKEGWQYAINADTLNERFDYEIPKPAGTFRIVTLGGSWTFGHLVDTKDTYPELLEDMLNADFSCGRYKEFEVVNLAVYGHDVQYMVERFRRRGVKYDADLVIPLLKEDDFLKPLELVKPVLDAYTNETGAQPQFNKEGVFTDELKDVRIRAIEEVYGKIGKEGVLAYQFAALRELTELHLKGILFFLHSAGPEARDFVEKLAASREGTFVYATKGLLADAEKTYYGGPNEKGHRMFAQGLYDFLAAEEVIPCD